MLNEIQMAIASITGAKTIAEGLVAERDANKIAQATTSLLSGLIEAQGAVLNIQREQALLQDELARTKKEKLELEQQLAQVVGKRQQLADYEPVGLASGAVYVLAQKPGKDGFRHPPYLCATCAEGGKQSILSFQTGTSKDPARKLVCPTSKAHTLTLPRGGWTLDNLGRSERRANP